MSVHWHLARRQGLSDLTDETTVRYQGGDTNESHC